MEYSNKELKENEITHRRCGGIIRVYLDDDGGCNDPECCGGTGYHIRLECDKCNRELDYYRGYDEE